MARRRGLGSEEKPFSVLCYFTRVFSSGVDEAGSFGTEKEALAFAKKCVKDGHGSNPHALVDNHYAGVHKTIARTRAGRLQTKTRRS
jgi:hypothetical protein